MKSYLTPKQLAAEFDVPKTCIYRWCRTGYFRCHKVGGRWRIDPDVDLESLPNSINEQIREGMKSKERNEVERLVSQILLSDCLLLTKANARSAVDTPQG